jgi:hypothetical protein
MSIIEAAKMLQYVMAQGHFEKISSRFRAEFARNTTNPDNGYRRTKKQKSVD